MVLSENTMNFLTEHTLKNKISQLLSKHKHGNNTASDSLHLFYYSSHPILFILLLFVCYIMYDVILNVLYARNVSDVLNHLKIFVNKDILKKNENLGEIIVLKNSIYMNIFHNIEFFWEKIQ